MSQRRLRSVLLGVEANVDWLNTLADVYIHCRLGVIRTYAADFVKRCQQLTIGQPEAAKLHARHAAISPLSIAAAVATSAWRRVRAVSASHNAH